jgi:hypothetical protein
MVPRGVLVHSSRLSGGGGEGAIRALSNCAGLGGFVRSWTRRGAKLFFGQTKPIFDKVFGICLLQAVLEPVWELAVSKDPNSRVMWRSQGGGDTATLLGAEIVLGCMAFAGKAVLRRGAEGRGDRSSDYRLAPEWALAMFGGGAAGGRWLKMERLGIFGKVVTEGCQITWSGRAPNAKLG